LDATCYFSSEAFFALVEGFSFLDRLLSKAVNILPGAEAALLPETDINKIERSVSPPGDRSCRAAKVYDNFAQNRKIPTKWITNPTNKRNIELNENFGQVSIEGWFENRDVAQKRIEGVLEGAISADANKCYAEAAINLIKTIKNPTSNQKQGLADALSDLLFRAKADYLGQCKIELIDLMDEISSQAGKYSIETLGKFPEILDSLLKMKAGDYSPADLEILLKKINEVSGEVVEVLIQIQTQDLPMLNRWIDVMLDSTARNVNSLESMFKKTLKIQLIHKKIDWQRQKNLRNVAKQYQNLFITEQQKMIAKEILDATGFQNPILNFIFSRLESIPEGIQQLENIGLDIAESFSDSEILKGSVALGLAFILMWNQPTIFGRVLRTTILAVLFVQLVINIASAYWNNLPKNEERFLVEM